jgi:hypothetical protein
MSVFTPMRVGLREPGKPLGRPDDSLLCPWLDAPPSQKPLPRMFSRGLPAMKVDSSKDHGIAIAI